MSDTLTVTVESIKDDDTGRPIYSFMWDFPPAIAPKFGEMIKGEATWKPNYTPNWTDKKKQTLDGAITTFAGPAPTGTTPPDPQLVEGASLYLERKFFNGSLEVKITWTVSSTGKPMSHTHTQTVGNSLNASQTVTQTTEAPRLSTALLAALSSDEQTAATTSETEPTDDVAARKYFGKLIEEAVVGIHRKLRSGLGQYWRAMGTQCKNDAGDKALAELRGSELDSLSMQQLDEAWAQLVTELFIGACYHGPGSHMGLSEWPGAPGASVHKKDGRFFRYVRMRAEGKEIPADDAATPTSGAEAEFIVSLCHACQQQDTAVLMSRNADFYSLADDPIDCRLPHPNGQISGKFHHMGNVGALTGVQLADNGWLVPGACYFRNPDVNHVGVVLRAFQSTHIQMLDTDGWNFNNNPFPNPPAMTTKYVQINSDTQSLSKLPNPLFGVLIPPKTDSSKLIAAVKLLQTARPLGLARLVVYRRSSGQNKDSVLYTSRKLFMHEGTGADYRYYSPAALLNSLRACPHADKLDIRWQIYRPLGNDAVRNACNTGRDSRWWDGTSSVNSHSPTIEMSVDSSGKSLVRARNCQEYKSNIGFDYYLNELEAVSTPTDIDAMRKKYKRLADVTNGNLPAYFQK